MLQQDRPCLPQHGVIVYLNSEETKVDLIRPHWSEMCALLASRNKLATNIRDSSSTSSVGTGSSSYGGGSGRVLPPMLHSVFDCQHCYQASECMVTHAALEGGTSTTSGVPELFSYILTSITAAQLRYFRHWDNLLTLEASASVSVNLPWASSHSGRNSDKCMTELVLASCVKISNSTNTGSGVNGSVGGDSTKCSYLLTFTRPATAVDATDISSVDEYIAPTATTLSVNDRVHLSVEADTAGMTHVVRAHNTSHTRTATSHTTTTTATTDNGAPDMEDIGLRDLRSTSRAVCFSDPNVCSGHIVSVTGTEVCVVVTDEPRRLNRFNITVCCFPAPRIKFW